MSSHPASLHVALPRARALTDVMLTPPGPEVDEIELARAREHVVSGLTEASRSARFAPGIRIDAYQLQLALTAPDRLCEISPAFNPTPASSRRSIGIEALSRCVRDVSLQPAQSVAEVLAEAETHPSDSTGGAWWEEWYRSLGGGARSVVQAEATTWATQLHTALEWRRFEPQALIGRDYRWECNRSPRVTLHSKVDVRIAVVGRPVLLLLPTGVPGPFWSAALALSALMAGLVRGLESVPARVVGMWPASGQVRILPVEPGTLDRASRLVVEAAWAISRRQMVGSGHSG
jgi:hypothetical protein